MGARLESAGGTTHLGRSRPLRLGDQRGVALVEFVLVAPILILILFAIVDFGRALNYRQQATHLTSEGARYAVVDKNPGSTSGQTLQQYLRTQAAAAELRDGSSSVTKRLEICISFPATTSAEGDPVKVEAKFDFQWLPILNLAKSSIVASSTMRIERAPQTAYLAGCVA